MSNETDTAKPRIDLYRGITTRIVEALERGVTPWVCPWRRNREQGPHRNGESGRSYRGINALLTAAGGFASTRWYTERQVSKLGGRILDGADYTPVIYWRMRVVETQEGSDAAHSSGRVVPVPQEHKVFNAEQIAWPEGSKHGAPVAPVRRSPWEENELPRRVVEQSGARVELRGTRAYYSAWEDRIVLPLAERFEDAASFTGTLLHELAHWTGHPDRLARDFSGQFGSEAYAMEELVAELTAAFLCAEVGVDGTLQHAEYIGSWLKVLRGDKKALFTAAKSAQAAADLVLGRAAPGRRDRQGDPPAPQDEDRRRTGDLEACLSS